MAFTNNRFLKFVIVCCCSVFVSCSTCESTDNILFSYIESLCPQGGNVNLMRALDVDYDTAFLFGGCTNEREIETALGIPYSQKTFLQDSEYKLILLKEHNIVYDKNFYCKRVEFFSTAQSTITHLIMVGIVMYGQILYLLLPKKISGMAFFISCVHLETNLQDMKH